MKDSQRSRLANVARRPEDSWVGLFQAVYIEYVATALFVFVATSCVTSVIPGSCFLGTSNVLNIAASFGGAIGVLVYCAASFSGGHLNPAVTVAFLVSQKISLLRAFMYIIFQCLGACTGSAFVLTVDRGGFNAALGAANRLNAGVNQANAFGVEAILTFILVFVILAATDSARATQVAHLPVLAPFAIGVAIFLAHLVAIPIDGCSINPARSFGPAAVAHVWEHHWIFWVGPIVGALLAAAVYAVANKATELVSWADSSNSSPHHQERHTAQFSGAQGLQTRPRIHSMPRKSGAQAAPAGQHTAVANEV